MKNSHISDLKDSQKIFKQIWRVGNKHVVIIDESIIQKLGINDSLSFVEQEVIEDGILMRIHHFETDLK